MRARTHTHTLPSHTPQSDERKQASNTVILQFKYNFFSRYPDSTLKIQKSNDIDSLPNIKTNSYYTINTIYKNNYLSSNGWAIKIATKSYTQSFGSVNSRLVTLVGPVADHHQQRQVGEGYSDTCRALPHREMPFPREG